MNNRWDYINSLDDEFIKGGVFLSEWCSFIVREADIAFASGADLASILTSVSGIETYLRSEYNQRRKESLSEIIENAPIDEALRTDLHKLRLYRNKWVHVSEPWNDQSAIDDPESYKAELAEMAMFSARVLRKTINVEQCV